MLLLYRRRRRVSRRNCCVFTFHYASTLSTISSTGTALFLNLHSTMLLLYRVERLYFQCPKIDLHSTMLLLYQPQAGIPSAEDQHLHSTMLLLYRRCNYGVQLVKPIYIPLCFYFIQTGAFSARNPR